MKTWTDRHGKEHQIDLDVVVAARLRDQCGIDLLACLDNPSKVEAMLHQLQADFTWPVQFLSVIEQTDEPEEFGRLFNGEVLVRAANAIMEEIIDFFQEPQRGVLKRLLQKTRDIVNTVQDRATADAMKAIDDPAFTTVVKGLLMPGNGSNDSLESSDTTAAV